MPPIRRQERFTAPPRVVQPEAESRLFALGAQFIALTLPSQAELLDAMIAPPARNAPGARAFVAMQGIQGLQAPQPTRSEARSQPATSAASRGLESCAPALSELLLITMLERGELTEAAQHYVAMHVAGVQFSASAHGRLVDALVADKAWPYAAQVVNLARLQQNPVSRGTIDAAVRAAVDDGDGVQARHLHEAHSGRPVTQQVCRDILQSFCDRRRTAAAVVFLTDLETNTQVTLDGRAYGGLLHTFVKEGRLEEAEQVLSHIESRNLHRSPIPYTMLLTGYGRAGRLQDVSAVWARMARHRVRPSHISYERVIRAFAEGGDLRQALRHHAAMEREGFGLDRQGLRSIMHAAIAADDSVVVRRFFQRFAQWPGGLTRYETAGLTRLGILSAYSPAPSRAKMKVKA